MTQWQAEWKRQAAEHAAQFVESGMVVGLGHGSTAAFAVRRIAQRIAAGELANIVAVPCSDEVASMATEFGIPLATLEAEPQVDLTIDGADEVDPRMDLIKGGGGALLREKLVAKASSREVIVVDETKLSPRLGTRFALPVEVLPGTEVEETEFLRSLGARVSRRGGGEPFVTDSGNHILDCRWPGIDDPQRLAMALEGRVSIADHGLFLGLASDLVVAGAGGVRHFVVGQDWSEVYPA